MKATGVVRSIDDLGRMCLPKGPRTYLGMEQGVYVEIHLNDSGDGIVVRSTNTTDRDSINSNGIYRKIDVLGRIVIPSSIRQLLNMGFKESIQVFTEEDSFILKKYIPGCIFTGEIKNVINYEGYNVSIEAIHELAKLANII